ncbi:MAG: PKD domain-containing protein [Chitinophagales bacterium]|nr:PKD domain-containing protein [Chitinophagales bacterium]
MKKLLPLFLLCYNFISAQNPITFNMNNAPVAGQIQRIAIDTFPLPAINFGNKGPNQVYDFSNLVLWKYDTIEYRIPTSAQKSTCPNADVATTLDGVNFLLTNTDTPNTKLTLEGFEGQLCPGQTVSAAYTSGQKPDLIKFPTVYGTTFSGAAHLQKTVPGSQVCQPSVSQVRLTNTTNYTDTIDGWGKVITPVGAYKCLRKQRKETTTSLVEAQIIPPFWTTVSNTTTTTIRYSYLTLEAKGSVLNFNYDSANVLQSVSWSMIPPTPPVADFTFAYAANGVVNFTDASDGYPTSWAWTFGDGGTSTQQNPSHTYAANGNYNVCLTATNAGGSSVQVCKQVTITNIPVTPVANFSWNNVSGGFVSFTDQSTNTPTQWSWTFGDGGTSTAQNPNHVYAANNTYNVCLTASNTAGSNQICKNVVVSGISAVNNAPVAVNDAYTVTGGSSTIFHVATNDVDPDGDNICMTAVWGSPYATEYIGGSCDMILYEPDSSFSGNDTCYYIICDNGTPVLCDTGMVVFTVNVLNLPPVAVNDSFSVLQATGIVFVVGANDTDPNNDNLCVNSVWGSNSVMINPGTPCTDIYYISDTCFTGLQTFYYSICDPDGLCDTAEVMVNVLPNPAYEPVAYFDKFTAFYYCTQLTVFNSSQNYTSSTWTVHEFGSVKTDTLTSDTLYYLDFTSGYFWGSVCLQVSNQCKTDYFCDTLNFACVDIQEPHLSNISFYPNPAGNVLTIDMSKNEEEITRSYASIEVYNALGEKVKAVRNNHSKMVHFSVADLANGMYVAIITSSAGERKTLGRFTVSK